jgi:hypothetical protein
MHLAVDDLRDFGVDTDSMHQRIIRVVKVFYHTQQEAASDLSRLVDDLGRITRAYDVDIIDSRIPSLVKECLQMISPGACLDDSFLFSSLGSEILSTLAPHPLPDFPPSHQSGSSSSSSSSSSTGFGPSELPFASEPRLIPPMAGWKLDMPPPFIPKMPKAGISQKFGYRNDIVELSSKIGWWTDVMKQLNPPEDSTSAFMKTPVQRQTAEIFYRHGANCLKELQSFMDLIVENRPQKERGSSSSLCTPQNIPSLSVMTDEDCSPATTSLVHKPVVSVDIQSFPLAGEVLDQEPALRIPSLEGDKDKENQKHLV